VKHAKHLKQHAKRLGAALAAVSAIGIAGALYFKTQPTSTEQHTKIVDGFGRLHTLDARIAQETLAARDGLAPNYDPLTRSSEQFQEALEELTLALDSAAQLDPKIAAALGELREQSAQRADAVERFKRQNSLLKNSLYYLPFAAQQVIDATSTRKLDGLGPARAISELVQVTLTQNLLGGRAETARVEEQLKLVEALKPAIPAEAGERFRLLLAHARTASRMQQQVDPIVRGDVLGAPVGKTLGELEQRYSQNFDTALRQASWYRTVLYAWSTLLLITVIVVAAKLRSLYGGLERLVAERTRKLDQAVKELWGEMELAKKIQTALVPHELSLRDCEVAAVMRPTTQVGGDYYDVFEVDGTEWVLIGDVSGHGVPAGLVMMMCQTSVHSVVTARPNISPDELLATVNRTLTQNIERLGEDKYMTISALRRDKDGSFKVAGMHQDLLVYRARSGRVEHLRAEGTWLGIAKNIRGLNPVRSLKLDPGDVLVLYTDGITEARRGGEMLDLHGLERAVLAHGNASASGMLNGILETLEGYEIKDDVAAVIVKQLQPQANAQVA
jgi:hypothetical protein